MKLRDKYKFEAKLQAIKDGLNISESQKQKWVAYKKIRNHVNNRIRNEEVLYKKQRVQNCRGCPEKLWKVAKQTGLPLVHQAD